MPSLLPLCLNYREHKNGLFSLLIIIFIKKGAFSASCSRSWEPLREAVLRPVSPACIYKQDITRTDNFYTAQNNLVRGAQVRYMV